MIRSLECVRPFGNEIVLGRCARNIVANTDIGVQALADGSSPPIVQNFHHFLDLGSSKRAVYK